eukprot:1874487-Lingulodinium_polyedra.AAC.1
MFFGLPTSLSEKDVHTADEINGKVDSAFPCVEPCEADPDQEQLVLYVIYADRAVSEWVLCEVNGNLLGDLPSH